MDSWLVMSNCQTLGLARSVSLLCSDIEVDSCDVWTYQRGVDEWVEKIKEYDRVITDTEILKIRPGVFEPEKTILIPRIYFGAYHPDLCLLYKGTDMIQGCLGPSHSLIAFAGFCNQLSVPEVCTLYNRRTYDRLGYFDVWMENEVRLLADFAEHNLDISPRLRRWSRGQAFMHTINHPKIECLYDLADVVLQAEGRRSKSSDLRPFDNLINDSCFPVDDEIATELGFKGSYQFKLPGRFKCLDLEQFVTESFKTYLGQDLGGVVVDHVHTAAFDRLGEIIQGGK